MVDYEVKINNKGFTIIELMVATAAFSVILLIASVSVIQIGKLYYRSILQSRTQETVRKISDEISQSIQFANGTKRNSSNPNQFCIGDTRYSYTINQTVVDDSTIGLRLERINPVGDCATTLATAPAKELLANGMRVILFDVTPVAGTSDKSYKIAIKVASGDNELLTSYTDAGIAIPAVTPQDTTCKSGIAGSNFCAVAELDSIVKKRLN